MSDKNTASTFKLLKRYVNQRLCYLVQRQAPAVGQAIPKGVRFSYIRIYRSFNILFSPP
jgi:hypothetical protein